MKATLCAFLLFAVCPLAAQRDPRALGVRVGTSAEWVQARRFTDQEGLRNGVGVRLQTDVQIHSSFLFRLSCHATQHRARPSEWIHGIPDWEAVPADSAVWVSGVGYTVGGRYVYHHLSGGIDMTAGIDLGYSRYGEGDMFRVGLAGGFETQFYRELWMTLELSLDAGVTENSYSMTFPFGGLRRLGCVRVGFVVPVWRWTD